MYGDVQRVKILYNKKDSALIQMAEPHQAHLGMLLYGSGFNINFIITTLFLINILINSSQFLNKLLYNILT